MTEPMTEKRLRQIQDRAGIYGPKGTDPNSSMRYVQELLVEVDRLKNLLKVQEEEEEEFAVVPYTSPRMDDIVEIEVNPIFGGMKRWNGLRGRVIFPDNVNTKIRLLAGYDRPDGVLQPEFYWPTTDLKIVRAAK